MGWYGTLKTIRQLSKHMKKNKELNDYMESWFKENYGTDDEKEILNLMQGNPLLIKEIAEHYNNIRSNYK